MAAIRIPSSTLSQAQAGMPRRRTCAASSSAPMARGLSGRTVTTASAMVVVSLVALLYNVNTILSFSFPMIIGMVSGFYSSVCIAPALWTMWQKKKAA